MDKHLRGMLPEPERIDVLTRLMLYSTVQVAFNIVIIHGKHHGSADYIICMQPDHPIQSALDGLHGWTTAKLRCSSIEAGCLRHSSRALFPADLETGA